VFALSRLLFSSPFWFQPLAWRVMAEAEAAFTEEAVVVSVALGMAVPPELEESMRALLKEAMEGGITSPAATTCSTEVGFERPL
jgi:hypothetical protein